MSQQINLNQFPGDTRQKLDAACAYCRENPGTTLFIPAGKYVLEDARAKEIMDDVLSGKYGNNPQPVMFRPAFPYTKGLDLHGCKNVTISAYGAVLMINGFMEPVSIWDAENVTVAGLTIDHVRKPFTRGWVTKIVDSDHMEVTFDPHTPPVMHMSSPRNFIINRHNQRIAWFMTYEFDAERVDDLKYIVHCESNEEWLGSEFYFTNTYHFRPGIHICHSTNTNLIDVTIHSQPGMGVVGFKSKDINMLRLRITPSDGYCMSTNTDGTHFACCSGTVKMENCTCIGQGDDAINIHNYYYKFLSGGGNKATILAFPTDGTHNQEPDFPLAGYRLQLVNAKSLQPLEDYTVVSSSQTEACEITLDHDLPQGDVSAYYFSNITDLPYLIFRGNHVRNHLARSVLCKTHNAIIENNFFDGGTGTAVHIAAEASWAEGIASKNVVVRNNYFEYSGCTWHGTTNGASAVSLNMAATDDTGVGIHEDIVIEGNEIHCPPNAECAFNIANAKHVIIRNNKIFGVDTPMKVAYCEDVESDIPY